MKKLCILFCLLFSIGYSQPTIPVKIEYLAPENVCIGDSVQCCFTLLEQLNPDIEFKILVDLYYFDIGIPIQEQIYKGTLGEFPGYDTLHMGSLYCLKMKIPLNLIPGQWCVGANVTSLDRFCIWTEYCIVGIDENKLDPSIIKYYDIYGRVTEPKPGVLLFTSERKKVIIWQD